MFLVLFFFPLNFVFLWFFSGWQTKQTESKKYNMVFCCFGLEQVIAMPGLSGVREMVGSVSGLSRMREEGTVPSKTGCCKISSAVV